MNGHSLGCERMYVLYILVTTGFAVSMQQLRSLLFTLSRYPCAGRFFSHCPNLGMYSKRLGESPHTRHCVLVDGISGFYC